MTMDEIARNLGVSKSTVSRALSGKGRIGDETRRRIISYAEAHGALAENSTEREKERSETTRNLGVVFPADIYVYGNPYFQECMLGICEAASLMGYNVLLTVATAVDISEIKKLVEEKKVDGIILTRSLVNDRAVEYLTEKRFPAGMTGICDSDAVIQVDTDNEGASETLTSLLIGKGFQKFALVVEDLSYHVNRSRYDGFCSALLKNGISKEKQTIYTGDLRMELLDTILGDIIAKRTECIICGDDVVCTRIMSRLQAEGYRIPRDIAIASLYNNQNLNCFTPAVTAVNVPAREVGNMIGKQMINCLDGKPYTQKTMVDYEILFRKSTNRI